MYETGLRLSHEMILKADLWRAVFKAEIDRYYLECLDLHLRQTFLEGAAAHRITYPLGGHYV